MKKVVLALFLLFALCFNLSWAQCPEDPNDLGICDTLYVMWGVIVTPFPEGSTCPCMLRMIQILSGGPLKVNLAGGCRTLFRAL